MGIELKFWLFLRRCGLLGAMLVLVVPALSQTELKFKHLSSAEGLPNNSIRCIVKDYKGFMWFGSENGLIKFDGYEFTHFKHDAKDASTISNNYSLCVYEDSRHNLWYCNSSSLNLYHRETDKFTSYRLDGPPSNGSLDYGVFDVVESKDKQLWLSCDKGIFKFDPIKKKFKKYDIKAGVRCLAVDPEGALWLGYENGGIAKFDGQKVVATYRYDAKDPHSVGSDRIFHLFFDSKGQLWVGTLGGGLDRFDPKSNSFIHYLDKLNSNHVNHIAEAPDGRIWLATVHGLNVLDPKTNTVEYYTSQAENPSSILNDNLYTVYFDPQHTAWLGSRLGGVDLYDPRFTKFAHVKAVTASLGLNSNTVSAFARDQSGNLWIATDGGGLNRWDKNSKLFSYFDSKYNQGKGPSNNKTLALAITKDDELWTGMWAGGLNRFKIKGDKLELIKRYDKLEPGRSDAHSVFKTFLSSSGQLWVGTWTGGLFLYDRPSDSFIPYPSDEYRFEGTPIKEDEKALRTSLRNGIIYNLSEDHDHNLWIVTQGPGLFRMNPKSKMVTHFFYDEKNPKSIGNREVHCVFEDSKQRIWVGTSSSGLNLYCPKTNEFVKYTTKDGLPDNNVCGILEDQSGHLWLSTFMGVSKLSLSGDERNPKIKCQNFNKNDGLQGNQFINWACFKSPEGLFYLGGSNGFNVFDPEHLNFNSDAPNVFITDFYILNQKQLVGAKHSPLSRSLAETELIELDYDQKMLTFKYAALNYINTTKNEFAYRLLNFDKDWYYVGSKREVTYTNLDPGEYFFTVKACNNDGVWNETGRTIRIIIHPPWWMSWWFRSLFLVLILASAFSIYYIRVRRLKEQKKVLEMKVKIRTQELENANQDLMESKREILQQNEEILQLADEMKVQRDLVLVQKEKVTKQNELINASVRYALSIQKATLPPLSILGKDFESFIIYRPKDIVSGDFYWFNELVDYSHADSRKTYLIVVADCTGHGVPGAFMSMIGSRLISEIVYEKKISRPSLMLEVLDHSIIESLRQNQSHNIDGMDIAICLLRKQEDGSTDLLFSGARSSIFVFQHSLQEITRLKGSHRSIGGVKQRSKLEPFEDQELKLQAMDHLYLFTDGLVDQNNSERQRLGSARIFDTIMSNIMQPMPVQEEQLKQLLDAWQGTEAQRDDITVLGLKIL